MEEGGEEKGMKERGIRVGNSGKNDKRKAARVNKNNLVQSAQEQRNARQRNENKDRVN